jgi:hypothetical protein
VPTPRGPVVIDWATNTSGAGGLTLTVVVPPGTRAYAGVPTTASQSTINGSATESVRVPDYTGLDGYRYFGPLAPGSHRIVAG